MSESIKCRRCKISEQKSPFMFDKRRRLCADCWNVWLEILIRDAEIEEEKQAAKR